MEDQSVQALYQKRIKQFKDVPEDSYKKENIHHSEVAEEKYKLLANRLPEDKTEMDAAKRVLREDEPIEEDVIVDEKKEEVKPVAKKKAFVPKDE